MSLLDGLMNQLGGQGGAAGGLGGTVLAQLAPMIATKFGIDPAMAQMAITALTQAHPQPGDTVTAAAQQTGMSPDVLGQIMGQLGGENALGQLGGMLGGAGDATGDGGQLGGMGGIGDILGGLMGGKGR